jgi:hypothetical protein
MPAGPHLASFEGPQLSTASPSAPPSLVCLSIACGAPEGEGYVPFNTLQNLRSTPARTKASEFWGCPQGWSPSAQIATRPNKHQTNNNEQTNNASDAEGCLVEWRASPAAALWAGSLTTTTTLQGDRYGYHNLPSQGLAHHPRPYAVLRP